LPSVARLDTAKLRKCAMATLSESSGVIETTQSKRDTCWFEVEKAQQLDCEVKRRESNGE
jgi:hypothetical protein